VSDLELFLARLYTDPEARRRFLASPEAEAASAGFAPAEVASLAAIDRAGLEAAAASFAAKRREKSASGRHPEPGRLRGFWRSLLRRAAAAIYRQ
jgi:hypothetical protein